jgi:probable HAF family extracellular repeat protein
MASRLSRIFTDRCSRLTAVLPTVGAVAWLVAMPLPASAATGAPGPSRYAVTILSTLSPNPALSSISNAAGINDRGWIVGDANYPGTWRVGGNSYGPNTTEHATVWRDGQITDLGTLGGPNSSIGFVARPNDTGLISGNAQNATVDPFNEGWALNLGCTASGTSCPGSQYELRAFVWKDGVIRPLPTLGGNNALGFGVGNNRGQLVGTAENSTHDPTCQPSSQVLAWEPVVWGPHYGAIHELPLYPGDRVGAATAINDAGQAVGGSGICLPVSFGALEHALLWNGRSTVNLGSLGGTYDNLGTAINDRGQVVGWSDLPGDTPSSGTTHAFLWQNGVMTDLGTLPGDTSSYAYGINDSGQVVGQSCDLTGNCQAFLWQDGTMTNLNIIADVTTHGSFDLPLAQGINSQGEIVGMAIDNSTGNTLGFSALPCDNQPPDTTGCTDAHNAIATGGPNAARPDIGLGLPHTRTSFDVFETAPVDLSDVDLAPI